MIRTFVTLVVIATLPLLAPANAEPIDVEWLDFSGWDHGQVQSTGQTLEDIHGDLDIAVTGISNSFTTTFAGNAIRVGGNSDAMSLVFTFSSPTEIIIEIETLDLSELLTVTSAGSITYSHADGMIPTQSGSLQLQGSGYGISPTGASNGFLHLDATSALTVRYEALNDFKYDGIRIGTTAAVPEPQTLALIGLGSFALVPRRRRR